MNVDTGKQLRLTILVDRPLMDAVEAEQRAIQDLQGYKVSKTQVAAEAIRKGLGLGIEHSQAKPA